jgi:hypothetical protein
MGGIVGSIAGAVAGPLIGGLLGPKSPKPQQAPGFTPYGVTTGFGTSTFDPKNQTAGYTLTPQMQEFVNQYYAGAQAAMPSPEQIAYAQQVSDYGQGLFGQATSMDINAMTQDYLSKQLALLEPARAAESSRLNDLQFGRGTVGQGVGVSGGYVNPQQFALAQAREQQNAALGMDAETRARGIQAEQLKQAGALYGLGQSYLTDPYTTANTIFGYGAGIENQGLNALTIGSNIGTMSAQGGNQAAQLNNASNQAQYLNQLSNANAWGNLAGQGVNAIGNVNWGGLFSGGGIPSGYVSPVSGGYVV